MHAPALHRAFASPSPDRWASAFVWGAWALMTLLAARLVLKFGVQLPFDDEWCYAEFLLGRTPVTLGYLWSFHNEHRIPLPRLVYIVSMKLTGCNFLAPMLANV